jgi:hypothetical protein
MHTDDYQYWLNQHQRADVQRRVRRQQLIRIALERKPKTPQAYAAVLLALWHSLYR